MLPHLAPQTSPPQLAALPHSIRTLRRTSRRMRRVGLFFLDVVARVRTRRYDSPRAQAAELSWVAENLAALHGLHIRVSGSLPSQPGLLVANHISYLDPLVICSQVPALPIAKDDVRGWPAVGEVGQRLGVLYVQRGSVMSGARVLRQVQCLLEQGVSVLVFPEGTTTRGQSVLPVLRGTVGIAARVGVPVWPVALKYDHPDAPWVGDATFVPHYMRMAVRACTSVSVHFRPPLHASAGVTARQLADAARDSLLQGLRETDSLAVRHHGRGAC